MALLVACSASGLTIRHVCRTSIRPNLLWGASPLPVSVTLQKYHLRSYRAVGEGDKGAKTLQKYFVLRAPAYILAQLQ